MGFFFFQDTQIHDRTRDASTGDDDLATITSRCESLSTEDKFFDRDIFECLDFWHGFLVKNSFNFASLVLLLFINKK